MHVDDEELVKQLDAMPQEEPPGDLRTAILTSIQAAPSQQKVSRFGRRPRRVIFAAGWGLAALVVLSFLMMVGLPSDERPYATMAPVATEYEAEDVTLSIWREGDLVKLEPRLTGSEPVSVSVGWDPNSAAFAGVFGAADASSQNNQTTFMLLGPSQRSVVSLGVHPAARSTVVRVLVNDVEVIRAEVPLNQ